MPKQAKSQSKIKLFVMALGYGICLLIKHYGKSILETYAKILVICRRLQPKCSVVYFQPKLMTANNFITFPLVSTFLYHFYFINLLSILASP